MGRSPNICTLFHPRPLEIFTRALAIVEIEHTWAIPANHFYIDYTRHGLFANYQVHAALEDYQDSEADVPQAISEYANKTIFSSLKPCLGEF